MDLQDYLGIAAVIGALVGAYVAWRKYRPETDQITVTTASEVNTMTLKFAGQVSEDNDELRKMLDDLRRDFDAYRSDTDAEMAQLRVELRAERAEKEKVQRENDDLKKRVDELENEVRALKSGRRS